MEASHEVLDRFFQNIIDPNPCYLLPLWALWCVVYFHLYSFRTAKMLWVEAQKLSVECGTRQILLSALAFAALAVALEEQVSGLILLFYRHKMSLYYA